MTSSFTNFVKELEDHCRLIFSIKIPEIKMTQKNIEERTEWIFCKDLKGRCSGLSPDSEVLDKVPKTIKVHGKEIKGWMVKIVQEKSEGHLDLDLSKHSDE